MSATHPASVSVVVPTYNRASLLRRALRSILEQTRFPDEIVVVDDGSTDNTASVVEDEFSEVRLLSQENRGVSAARNLGIMTTSGDWVAFLDSDDEWVPEKLERQLAALGSRSEFQVCHTDEIWIRNGRRVNPRRKHAKYGGRIFRYCLPLCAMSPSSVMIHRSVFKRVGLFDEDLPACEDYDLWLRICCRYPVLYLDELLVVKYGGHPDQLSRNVWGLDRFRIQALEKILGTAELSEEERIAAIEILIEKIEIFIAGAQKRDKLDEANNYLGKLQRWQGELTSDSMVIS